MKKYHSIIANGGAVCYNIKACRFSAFKSGGAVALLLKPRGKEGLIAALDELGADEYSIIGACTNTLISDSGVTEPLLYTRDVDGYSVDKSVIHANAGETVARIAGIAKNQSLSGMEELSGIPGSIGGAITMNAGAFGREIAEILDYVDLYIDGKEERVYASDIQFGYRTCVLPERSVILSAGLKLARKNKALISNKMKDAGRIRRKAQPQYPSLGSVFKRYGGVSAGKYIEDAGLKGYRIGDAAISETHANFIINCGNATSDQYLLLAELAEREVFKKFNIKLEREIRYLS